MDGIALNLRTVFSPRFLSVLLFFILGFNPLTAQKPGPSSPPLWRRVLGGSIKGAPAQGPNGDLYVIVDDRGLYSINPDTGRPNWVYRPGGRLHDLLLVAPDSTIYIHNDRQEIFAVSPQGKKRWHLSLSDSLASLPAASPEAGLILPLIGGQVLAISRRGKLLWSIEEKVEVACPPIVRPDGIMWLPLVDGRLLAFDRDGKPVAQTRIDATPTSLALDGMDRLWLGSLDGSVRLFPDFDFPRRLGWEGSKNNTLAPLFTGPASSSPVLSILTHVDGASEIFFLNGLIRSYHVDGTENKVQQLEPLASGPSSAADGTFYLPGIDGVIRILSPEGIQKSLLVQKKFAEPLLISKGLLITGGDDWVLSAWQAKIPGKGWRQSRGGPSRSGISLEKPFSYNRIEARKDPQFYYRERMARSYDLAERLTLLDELEAYPNESSMRRALPWIDLLLEDLAVMGTLRNFNQETNESKSHPVARARAYSLLVWGDDFRVRKLLLDSLASEEDPYALAAGFRALGQLGIDWDGASIQFLRRRLSDFPPSNESLILASAQALKDLILYNGITNDAIIFINSLLQRPLSQNMRGKILRLLRIFL